MTQVTGLTQALQRQQSIIETDARNVQLASKPGATRRVQSLVHDGRGGAKAVEMRLSSQFALKSLLSRTATANGAAVQARYAGDVDRVFGDVKSAAGFVKRLDESFTSLQSLTTAGSVSATQVIGALEQAASTVRDTAEGLFSVAAQVEEELGANITELNGLIRQLYDTNIEISNATNSKAQLDLHDVRDELLNRLAEHFDLAVSYASDGRVYVRALGQTLVGKGAYAQLAYDARGYSDLTSGKDAAVVTCSTMYSSGSVRTEEVKTAHFGGAAGTLAGLVQVRDKQLPEAISAVNAVARTVIDNANKVHNQHASLGNTGYTASRAMAANDFVQTSGKVRVQVVRNDGSAATFTGAAGIEDQVRAVDIDLGAIHSIYGKGQATVKDLMAEVVAKFDHDAATDTVSMGAIANPAGGTYAGQNLLNDIRIVGTQNVATDGSFEFDLELDNSSHFGSKVEILSVDVTAGGMFDASTMPAAVDLAAGEKARAGAAMRVTLPAAAAEVRLRVRVIGENGQVNEGVVAYAIDRTVPNQTALMNKRLKGAPAAGIAGDLLARPDFMPTMLQTRMVDVSGNIVTDPDHAAYVVLETVSDEFNVIIEDASSQVTAGDVTCGFGQLFGFNDVFTGAAALNPALSISIAEGILADPSTLASSKLASHKRATADYVVAGDVAAHETITFNAGPLPAVADTITIDGEIFRFVNAAGGANDIVIGADWNATIANIVTQVSNHPNMVNLVTVARHNLDGITITAKHAGNSGDGIELDFFFGGGAQAQVGAVAMTHTPGVLVTLQGGTNKAQESLTLPELGLSFIAGNEFAGTMAGFAQMHIDFAGSSYVAKADSTTLAAVVSRTHEAVVLQYDGYNRGAKVSKTTLDHMAESFNREYGIDKDAVWAQLMENTQFKQMITTMIALLHRSNSDTIRTIAAAAA